jgi:hypothetical protein
MPTLAGSPALVSPMKRGCPEPFVGGGGSAETVVRAIVYMSAREALMEGLGDEGRYRGGEGVREEKDGTESSRRACARVPISQLDIASKEFSTGGPLAPSGGITVEP